MPDAASELSMQALLAIVFFGYVGLASLAVCLLGFSAVAVFCLGLFLASVGESHSKSLQP